MANQTPVFGDEALIRQQRAIEKATAMIPELLMLEAYCREGEDELESLRNELDRASSEGEFASLKSQIYEARIELRGDRVRKDRWQEAIKKLGVSVDDARLAFAALSKLERQWLILEHEESLKAQV